MRSIGDYIDHFYNFDRRHSHLGYLNPSSSNCDSKFKIASDLTNQPSRCVRNTHHQLVEGPSRGRLIRSVTRRTRHTPKTEQGISGVRNVIGCAGPKTYSGWISAKC